MKTAIIGGGPSGLFLAVLLRRFGVSDDVSVFEQNPEDATYGFGVALANSAIDKLSEAEPESIAGLQERMYLLNRQVIENCNGSFCVESTTTSGAITRLEILDVLRRRCDELGIAVHYETRIRDVEDVRDADLVVGADGANSVVRTLNEQSFGTRKSIRPNRFAWYGCEHTRGESGLRFRRYDGGRYIAHYYPYTPERWTFVCEVDAETWVNNGLDEMSDAERKKRVEVVFADVLDGHTLIENRSLWTQFEAITNDNWSVGNIALIGDALFRAHYSIGSGTRLAMEDALGLATALKNRSDDLAAALVDYEMTGRPRKEKLMAACEASYRWYETVSEKFDWPILDFIHDFMNRTGRMPEERLRRFAPGFVKAYEASQDAGMTR